MSGASDLQLFEELVNNANSLFLSDADYVVINGVTKPTLKKIYADFLASINTYPTVADGLSETSGTGTQNRFFTVPGADGTFETRYRNDAGTAVDVGRISSADVVEGLTKLVKGIPYLLVGGEEAALALADEEGGEFLLITSSRARTPAFEAVTASVDSGLYDAEGGAVVHAGPGGISLGPLMLGTTTLPGIYVTDQEDNIILWLDDPGEAPESLAPRITDPLSGGVYFAPKVVTAPGTPLHLDVSSMIAPRDDNIGVVASISSHSTAESSSSTRELIVQASKFGTAARLKLRDPDNALTHHVMDLTMVELPAGPFPGAAPNVLCIGDSILNRQGAQFLSEALASAGYSANFIGTMPGSASATSPTDMSGPMGEGRESYSTGNYTYAEISEITIPLEPGDEAAYLAMSKVDRRNRNPFIRAATGGDDPAIVRNGYVLDFAFYQSRFSLPTPDVIVYALGMNEFIRVTNGNELYAYMLDNERLMMQRIRAAWPDVKILRCLPGLPFQKARNPQWTDRYIPMIRGVMTNLNDLANPKNTLVPSWTFANPETGYATGNDVVDPITGIHQVEITDNTHPIGANRRRLYQGIAPYIAAAQLNLI